MESFDSKDEALSALSQALDHHGVAYFDSVVYVEAHGDISLPIASGEALVEIIQHHQVGNIIKTHFDEIMSWPHVTGAGALKIGGKIELGLYLLEQPTKQDTYPTEFYGFPVRIKAITGRFHAYGEEP